MSLFSICTLELHVDNGTILLGMSNAIVSKASLTNPWRTLLCTLGGSQKGPSFLVSWDKICEQTRYDGRCQTANDINDKRNP